MDLPVAGAGAGHPQWLGYLGYVQHVSDDYLYQMKCHA